MAAELREPGRPTGATARAMSLACPEGAWLRGDAPPPPGSAPPAPYAVCSLSSDESAILDPIAQRNHAAHPHSLLLRSADLVPNPLARDLPLELGEGQQHVESQT